MGSASTEHLARLMARGSTGRPTASCMTHASYSRASTKGREPSWIVKSLIERLVKYAVSRSGIDSEACWNYNKRQAFTRS